VHASAARELRCHYGDSYVIVQQTMRGLQRAAETLIQHRVILLCLAVTARCEYVDRVQLPRTNVLPAVDSVM